MKKIAWGILGIVLSGAVWAAPQVPSQITYQGTLKEQGVPVNGARPMTFRLTNQDGSVVYWSNPAVSVSVAQGLFSVVLSPSGVDWQNVHPYLELNVGGQLLLPREPITSTAYALVSGTVVDGGITRAKLDTVTQSALIPSGMIAMFTASCPAGWTRFAPLDNTFPMGGSAYGATGGSATHTHSISTDGAHNHGGATGLSIGGGATASGFDLGKRDFPLYGHTHSIAMDGAHNHGGSTGAASSLPPYLTVVWCQKN